MKFEIIERWRDIIGDEILWILITETLAPGYNNKWAIWRNLLRTIVRWCLRMWGYVEDQLALCECGEQIMKPSTEVLQVSNHLYWNGLHGTKLERCRYGPVLVGYYMTIWELMAIIISSLNHIILYIIYYSLLLIIL